jgi:outer membrane protein
VEFTSKYPLYEHQPFLSQLTRNWGLAAGLNLNVPLYTRGQIKTNIQLAEINIKNAQLNTELQKQSLRQSIERAYLDVKISYSNYMAILKQIEAQNKALQNIQKQLDFGVGNQTDFILSKNNFTRAQNDLIRAKYDFLFKQKILEFYEKGEMSISNQ